jgi:hypothetical protein
LATSSTSLQVMMSMKTASCPRQRLRTKQHQGIKSEDADMTTIKQLGAIRAHTTATDDESNWDAAAAKSSVNATPSNLKAMHAFKDPEGGDDAVSAYSYPHHNVNADGSVGAANTSACSSGIASLNGGRGGHSMSTDDKVGVYNHLSKHLEDAGKEAPPLKGAGAGAANTTTTKAKQFAAAPDQGAISAAVADAMGVDPSAVEVEVSDDGIEVETDMDDGTTVSTEHTIGDDGTVVSTTDSGPITPGSPEAAQAAAVESAIKSAGATSSSHAPPPATAAIASSRRGFTDVQLPPVEQGSDNSFDMPVMAIEGIWTGDGRFIAPGALTWRDLPFPVMALKTTTNDHNSAELVGKMNIVDRRESTTEDFNSRTQQPLGDGTNIVFGTGVFDTADGAAEVKRLVGEQFLRGVSIDIGDAVSDLVWLDVDGNECPPRDDDDDWDLFDLLFGFTADAEPQPGEPYMMGEKIIKGRIMGATICPFPAFEGAYVTVGDVAMAASGVRDKTWLPSINIIDKAGERRMPNGFVASGKLAAPMVPPHQWFTDPGLDGPTALTIEPSGEVYGHLALWTECHMSYQSSCVRAPHSMTDYAYFRTGAVLCEEDALVPTGVITMNTGHAELWRGSDDTKAHYDNTGTAVVDVAAGDDQFGIWIHGSLRPDVDQLTIRRLRGAALSGDWRSIGGNLELVAALAVNVPGFPIKRPTARVAAGAPVALVAAGRLTQNDAKRLLHKGSAPAAPADAGYSKKDLDVMFGYVKRDLRSQVHKDRR